MIEVQHIKKGFDGRVVIDDVSAVMDTGKCNLIIGSSGSGKTVLMKCIVGLFNPDAGNIIYDEQNFTTMNIKEKKAMRQQIGMLFQGSALFDSMTVEQNIMFPLDMFSDKTRGEKQKAVA
jgi:phospholipid/cholesterol/gamma-HCH transport system ATP-binding protein